MKWISVRDRLPKGERVLVVDEESWIFCGFYEEGIWENTAGDEAGVEVTHWMPLPEPPVPVLHTEFGSCGSVKFLDSKSCTVTEDGLKIHWEIPVSEPPEKNENL